MFKTVVYEIFAIRIDDSLVKLIARRVGVEDIHSREIICIHIKIQNATILIGVLSFTNVSSILNALLLRNWSYLKVETVISRENSF